MSKFFKQWFALIILLIGLLAFYYFNLGQYFTFTALKQHREMLMTWTNQNYFLAVISFMVVYIACVSLSFPGASFLTLIAGFLFGIFWGTVFVVISATIGATTVFLAVKTALEPWLAKKADKWLIKMRKGFQNGAIQYLLILRLIPLFPFWVVNIIPGLLGVHTSAFIFTTLIGIIPGSFIYVLLGSGLGHVLDQNQTPNLSIIFQPQIFLALLGLALLALLPSIYKFIKRKYA